MPSESPHRIEWSRSGAFAPAAVPGRARMVFSQDRSDFDIFRFEPPDRETPVVASSVPDKSPRFSPDGTRIAFESSRSGSDEEIWVADADGGNPVQLTGGPVDANDERWRGAPSWSPDGARIAFNDRSVSGTPDLWTVTVDGGALKRLTKDAFHDGLAAWSPDGRWVYYRQDRPDGRDIVRIPATGGHPERVTHDGTLFHVLSPDGTTLYYAKREGTSPLFALPIGGVERQIVDCARSRSIAAAAGGLYYAGCDVGRVPVYRRDSITGLTRTLGYGGG